MTKKLISDEIAAQVITAYKEGMKITEICKSFEMPQSTVYWLLERHGQSARRSNRNVHLSADETTVAHLYDLILEQEEYIQELEKEVKTLRNKLNIK